MKLEGDYLFDASVPEVWSALFDPVILAAVMPGCEKLDLVDGQYVGEIKVKVGPIQGKFTGKVDLKDKDEPRSYTMVVDGRGAPGFIKATALVKLAAEGDATRVTYDSDAQIGGKIASVGQRLIEASARAIVAQSLEGLHTNIKLRAAAYREAAAQQAAAGGGGGKAETLEAAAAIAPAVAEAVKAEDAAKAKANDVAVAKAVAVAAEPAGEPAVAATAAVGTRPTDPVAPAAPVVNGTKPTSPVAPAAPVSPVAPAAPVSPVAPAAPVSPVAPAAPVAPVFTPVKTKQSDLANAVAKEVASSLFPRSVLVAIILIQALVIVWLAVRH
jgi:carbon monoxide dehydrogenase subunit G